MKKLLFFSVILLLSGTCFVTGIQAQGRPRSTVVFTLSDGSPLTMAVNDRYFRKIGRRITLSDLPGKRPYVKVYRFRESEEGKGGKAELIFRGKVRIEPGKSYQAVVDPQSRQLTLTEFTGQHPSPQSGDINISGTEVEDAQVRQMPQLDYLQQQMDKKEADMEKLKLAKAYTDKNTYRTEDLREICAMLLFDDSRLELLNYAYKRVSDPEQYSSLETVFATDDAKGTFQGSLKNRQ